MLDFNKYSRKWVAKVFADGHIEVEEAKSDSIQGRVFFKCPTTAFKTATLLIERGLILKGRTGWYKTKTGWDKTQAGTYLGACIFNTRDILDISMEYKEEIQRSKRLHDSGYIT